MNNNKIIVLLSMFLAIAAVFAVPARSQDDGSRVLAYGFLMLEEPINPRNIAMGSAGTALGGSGFRYYNPVAPFFSAAPYVSAEFGQMPGDVNKGGFEAALVFPEWFAAVSFYSNSVDFETRDERGMGATASSGTTFGAASAGYVRDNLSLAIGLNAAEDRIWKESSYSAIALSVGMGYRLLDGKLNVGSAMFHNVAWSKGFGENASKWSDENFVPRFARVGAAWTDTLRSLPYTVAADVVYHAFNDEDGMVTVPVGVDVKILPYVNLRMGKRIGWDSEIMSFGIGLSIDRIAFDAAFVPTVFVEDYEMKWSMSFTYSLGARTRQKTASPETHVEVVEDKIDVAADTAIIRDDEKFTPEEVEADTTKIVPDESAPEEIDVDTTKIGEDKITPEEEVEADTVKISDGEAVTPPEEGIEVDTPKIDDDKATLEEEVEADTTKIDVDETMPDKVDADTTKIDEDRTTPEEEAEADTPKTDED